MKILFITASHFYQEKGVCIRVWNLAKTAEELGHEVHIACYGGGADKQVTTLRTEDKELLKTVGPSFKRIPRDYNLYLLCRRLTCTEKYDLIQGEDIEGALIGLLVRDGKPLVYDIHGDLTEIFRANDFLAYPPILYLARKFQDHILKKSDVIIANWPTTFETFKKYVPKMHTLVDLSPYPPWAYNLKRGIEIRGKLGIDENKKVILYTGNLSKYQGLNMLIDALKLLLKKRNDIILVIMGSRPEKNKKELQERILREELVDHILLNEVFGHDKAAFMANSDVLVSPRLKGTYGPLKIVSYLWSGKPIVATDTPSSRQIIDEKTAYMSNTNPEDLAKKIMMALSDDGQKGENSLRLARDYYSFEMQVKKLKTIYESLNITPP